MSKPKIKEVNWYGFKHSMVARKIPGGLTYIRTFCIGDYYHPVAVYKVANPDRSKGHKDYVLLQTQGEGDDVKVLISGMNEAEMKKHRYQAGVRCMDCKLVMYSVNRHHYHHCGCGNETMVDGGRDYLRYGGKYLEKIKPVLINLLTGKLVKHKKPIAKY